MSELEQTLKASTLTEYIELFIVDCLSIPAINQIFYLTPSAEYGQTILFNSHTYSAFDLQLSGVGESSSEAPNRPTLTLSNVNNIFGQLALAYTDLVGCKVTYIRTFAEYLGTSSNISAPPFKYLIRKKVSQDRNAISFTLGTLIDMERGVLPKRQMLKRDFPGLGRNKIVR